MSRRPASAAPARGLLAAEMNDAELNRLETGAEPLAVSGHDIQTLPSDQDALPGSWQFMGSTPAGSLQDHGPYACTIVKFSSANWFKRRILSKLVRKRLVSANLVFSACLSADKQWILVHFSSLQGALSGSNQHLLQLSTRTDVIGLREREAGQHDSPPQRPLEMAQHGQTSGVIAVKKLTQDVTRMEPQERETHEQISARMKASQDGAEIEPATWDQRKTEQRTQIAPAGTHITVSEVHSRDCTSAPIGPGIPLSIGGDPRGMSLLLQPVQTQELREHVRMAFRLADNSIKQLDTAVFQLDFKARVQLLKLKETTPRTAQDFPTLRLKLGKVGTTPQEMQRSGPASSKPKGWAKQTLRSWRHRNPAQGDGAVASSL